MEKNEIQKIFALLYEIKKRLTKLERNMIEVNKDRSINPYETNTSDFTRGSSLW